MNKTKIDWADYTWNPIVGCKNGCFYCYAKPMFERFHPGQNFKDIHVYPERFNEPMKFKEPLKIFIGSMTDMIDARIPPTMIKRILKTIENCPQHTFIFLTKSMYDNYKYLPYVPENCWFGITITGTEWEIYNQDSVEYLLRSKAKIKFINFEPLLDVGVHKMIRKGINWIIIGGLTGIKAKGYESNKNEIERILKATRKYDIPVFIKDNIKWPVKVQNYPKLS